MTLGLALGAALGAQAQSQPPRQALTPERKAFSAQDQAKAGLPAFPDARFFADSTVDFRRALPPRSGAWLALSAGGEDGAFGAGVLTGWSGRGRPEFSLVSGVSTGALIGVYAFLGAAYDAALEAAYTTINATDVFEVAGTSESLVDAWPLRRLVDRSITPRLLRDVAAAHDAGRRLFVVTTNRDAGRPVVWNMGAIARRSGDEALALFKQVLLASSSIPGVFQPMLIDVHAQGRTFHELHVDGGLTNSFYVAPESLVQDGAADLPVSELYILVNGKLTVDFGLTQRKVLPILGRSFSVALKAGERLAIAAWSNWAQMRGVELKVAHIPGRFALQSKGSFDPDYMKALFAEGRQSVRGGQAFQTRAGPRLDQGESATAGLPR
jgi:predicted acylesterase/phospholipase RssA